LAASELLFGKLMPYSFPSNLRKSIRVPVEQAYGVLSQVLEEISDRKKSGGERVFRVHISKGMGIILRIRLLPEGEFSSLEFNFDYRGFIFIILAALAILIGLSLLLSSFTLLVLGVIVMPILAYRASFTIERFLRDFYDILRGLEIEYSRRKLMEDRARWQRNPKNVDDLYKKLCEKHVKTWGDTYALKYKIEEYQRRGLTRDEAIRKIAEEEGIF